MVPKTYDKGAEQAAMNGWSTAHLPGRHLHMLTNLTPSPQLCCGWQATGVDPQDLALIGY